MEKRDLPNENTIAQPIMADAMAPLPLIGQADLVVLDPPCSSTGVFAKQPSAKWRLGPKSIDRMAAIQWAMINSCAEKVKPGGVMTYSTCSITLEENEAIIERFLKEHTEFMLARYFTANRFAGTARLYQMPTFISTHSPMQRILYSKTSKESELATITFFVVILAQNRQMFFVAFL